MYLYLGQNVTVAEREILGLFDMDNTSWSFRSREFLERAEQEGRTRWLTEDLPRSFVLVQDQTGQTLVYFSPFSVSMLSGQRGRFK